MAHCSLVTTYTIDTSLGSENAIKTLEHFWSDNILTALEHIAKGEEITNCNEEGVVNNGLGDDYFDNLISELEDYSFEEGDHPEFFESAVSVSENGRITLTFNSEGEYDHLEYTIGYSAMAIQKHFGAKEYFSRCNVVETRNKQYIDVARISNSMQTETVYTSY